MTRSNLFLLCVCASLIVSSPCLASRLPPFTSTTLHHPNGTDYDFMLVSALSTVPRNPTFLIASNLLGEIRLVRVRRRSTSNYAARTLATTSAGPGRSVLGIQHNPFHKPLTESAFFISTSSLQWRDQGFPDSGWQNGMVELLILNHIDKTLTVSSTIASGLPVSLSNWGVFGTVIDNAASLFISIGTFNNGGVPSEGDGNLPDCVASGSLLKLNFRNPVISGQLEWSSDDPALATLTTSPAESGVSIFATGIRSCFQPVYTSSGKLFCIDGGANLMPDQRSTSCTRSTRFEVSEPDKVLNVRQGKWYGHANRARGRTDPQQCQFVPAMLPARVVARRFPGYTPPLFTSQQGLDDGIVGSGTVGVTEYTAAWFRRIRGKLIGTESGQSEDVTRSAEPGTLLYDIEKRRVGRLADTPGISAAVDIYGSILTAQVAFGKVGIAMPRVSEQMMAREAIRVVFPTRGVPGSRLFIFGTSLKGKRVKVGEIECNNVKLTSVFGGVIRCKVPKGLPMNRALSVSVGSARLGKAFTVLDGNLAQKQRSNGQQAE